MKDGKQNISLDRWLMRIKDILQISLTVAGIFWGAVRFIRAIDARDQTIKGLQSQITQLRVERAKQRR